MACAGRTVERGRLCLQLHRHRRDDVKLACEELRRRFLGIRDVTRERRPLAAAVVRPPGHHCPSYARCVVEDDWRLKEKLT